MDNEQGEAGLPWTLTEIEATVATYFQMLRMQELGQKANKAEHNRRLLASLPARSIQAVEYKHRNISAVMNLYGVQTLAGYKPAANFQQLLMEIVGDTWRVIAHSMCWRSAASRRPPKCRPLKPLTAL